MNLIPKNYVQQIISIHKTTFENSFAAVDMLQGQAEQLVASAWRQAPWMPAEGKTMLDQWVGNLREGRNAFRQSVQKGFESLVQNLIQEVKQATSQANEATKERTAPSKNGRKKSA
jgi:hypothetical protein